MPSRRRPTARATALPQSRLPLGTPQVPSVQSSPLPEPVSCETGASTTQHQAASACNNGDPTHLTDAAADKVDDSSKKMATEASSSLANVSLAEAKLARQNKRIQQAEAALTAPLAVDSEHQASPRKGKGSRHSASLLVPCNTKEGGVPTSEVRVSTYRPSTRDTSLSRSMSSLSQHTGASEMEGNDSAQLEGGGFQVFTGRKNKRSADQLGAYTDKPEERQTTVEATFDAREIYQVFGNALPGPEFIEQNVGGKDGELKFVQHPNGDVSAHQWSETRYIWENVGQFSNIRKKVEGQLASERLKGETAYQKLQQHTLAYFRTIAKQREASVMGLTFGSKEIQAAMPDMRPPPTAPAAPRKSTNDPQEQHASLPSDVRKAPDDTERSAIESDPQYWAKQFSSREDYGGHMGYGGSAGYRNLRYPFAQQQWHPGVRASQYQPYVAPAMYDPLPDPFYLADQRRREYGSLGGSMAGQRQPLMMGPDYGHPAGLNDMMQPDYDYHFPPAGIARRASPIRNLIEGDHLPKLSGRTSTSTTQHHSTYQLARGGGMGVTNAMTEPRSMGDGASAIASRPKPVTPLSTRNAMRDQLIKLGDQAKERSNSQANIRTLLHDPFRVASAVPMRSDAEPVQGGHLRGYKTVANPSGLVPTHQQPGHSKSDLQPITPAPDVRRTSPPISNENAKDSSPEDAGISSTYIPSTSTNHHTPQDFEGPFFTEPSSGLRAPGSSRRLPNTSQQSKDKQLNEWWTSGNTFRRQEEFYRSLNPVTRGASNYSSPASLAPVGTPAKKAPPSYTNDPMTRLLIPVLENLAAYVQGPLEKRRDYFSRWTQPPEWCIDRSPNGNNSFFDHGEWGTPPARVGRDPRYRPLPVESVRFGAFGSPQAGASLVVGSGLGRRFAFWGKGVEGCSGMSGRRLMEIHQLTAGRGAAPEGSLKRQHTLP